MAQFVIISAHRLKRLKRLGRGEKALFAVVGRLHEHHHTHPQSPVKVGFIGLASERRTGLCGNRHRPANFSTVEVQGANGRFQVRDRDGA